MDPSKTTNTMAISPGGGTYQEFGVGNSAASFREVTRGGRLPGGNTGPGRSQGETAGVGSIYAAQLNERPNLSNPRNRGPERAPSVIGGMPLPLVTMASRATGRLSGSD